MPRSIQKFPFKHKQEFPMCGLIHYSQEMLDLLEAIADGHNYTDNIAETVLLEENFPLLSHLLRSLNGTVMPSLSPVIREAVRIARYHFVENSVGHPLGPCVEGCDCSSSHLGYFPTLPQVCHRGDYALDSKKQNTDSSCNKKGGAHPTLIPGPIHFIL